METLSHEWNFTGRVRHSVRGARVMSGHGAHGVTHPTVSHLRPSAFICG